MYLQALELQGFKSFPDKVRLGFDKGLTAVVGPNGSGKSNIGDAVRWVLGEQSTKTLRGNKMEDVIFSGTKSRKPMGFASVTLEINNKTGELGEEYGEVVSVTRKLYRSGDSEYRINGKSVRLKDITELFMDTGMGKDGYALIGQGRIAEIVGAKSQDRRDIFEEAAGVSKFRYKKQEAQRKLDAAQENLFRLQDILMELEGRVGPLKIQAEKAKQYVELAESQRELEVSLWVKRVMALVEKKQQLNNSYLQAKAEYENAQRQLERSEATTQEAYRRIEESTQRIAAIREKVSEAEETASKLNAEIAVCENDVGHCQQELERIAKQLEDAKEQCSGVSLRLESYQEQRNVLAQKKADLQEEQKQAEEKREALNQQATMFGEEYEGKSRKLQQLQMHHSELRATIQSTNGQLENNRAQQAEQAMQMSALKQELDTQDANWKEADGVLQQATEQFTEAQNRFSGFQQKYARNMQSLEEGRTKRENAGAALREKRQKLKLLEDMERNMEGFQGSVKRVLRADGGHPHGVHGTVAQLITTDSKYGVAIETALGGAMQNLIVEDESVAKQWIRFLQQNKAGRATFLPLTSVRGRVLQESGMERYDGFIDLASNLVYYDAKYSEIVKSLLGRIVVATDLDEASELAKSYGYKFKIVTLDGQVINAGGSYTGGSAQRSGGMLTRRVELTELSGEVKQLEDAFRQAEDALEQMKLQSKQLQAQLEQMRGECAEAESEKMRAGSKFEQCRFLLEQARSRVQETQQRQKQLEQEKQELQQRFSMLQDRNVELEAELEEIRVSIDTHSEKKLDLQKQQEEISEVCAQLKIRGVELERDIAVLEGEQQQQKLQQESMQTLMEQLQASEQEQLALIEEKKQCMEGLQQEIEQARATKKSQYEEIEKWESVNAAQNEQIKTLQSGMREINGAMEKYSSEMTKQQERLNGVQKEYDGVVSQLFDQYELSLSEAQQQAKPLEDLSQANRDLQSIKSKIRGLGTVNVSAIEEYKEVSERYEFMNAQVKDAVKSKQELEELIENLTQEMQHLFSESFVQINRNFKEIFRDLFGGGEANLELTDPDNVLESGIEIKVAPPGKVIKNLISLSGGEQSFVAIAIYFSILKLRPSPFCILDEIDAALDEGNVRKYAQYLQNFTNTTQFILVTHRRSAMEEASVLYGVTMQEDGVSRLLRMEQEDFSNLETVE